jgi:hypothetical protein
MIRRASLCVIIAACGALTGCQPGLSRQEAQVTYRPESNALYRPAVWPFFFPASKPLKCDKTNSCVATINSTLCVPFLGCTGALDNDPIHLDAGTKDIDILWTLPGGFGFCTALGDGVFLKLQDDYDQDEFDQMQALGTASGPKNECQQQYHWRGKHKNSRPDYGYSYRMVFHDSSNKLYVVDPWIFND